MKHLITILLILCFGLSSLTTTAQNTDDDTSPSIPKIGLEKVEQENVLDKAPYKPPSIRRLKLEKAEDYERYEPQILEAIEFIKNAHMNSNDERISKAIVFFFKWLEGSPSVVIEAHPYVGTLSKKNDGFILFFFMGWTEFVLNDKSQKDNYLDANVAGVEFILDYYKKGKEYGIKKDKQVMRFIELKEQGKLKEFIQEVTGLEEFVPEEIEGESQIDKNN